jgi:hypothetical protein
MKSIQVLPTVPMKRYGENPYAEALYRVVFSDSRTDLLGGKWPDGNCEYRESPRYPGIRGQWILEKWCSAEEYAGTREEYERTQFDADSGLLTCGPYPYRGEYVHCYTFPCAPGDGMIYQIVSALKISRDLTAGHRKQGIMEPLEKQQRARDARFSDIWDNSMGPWQKADAVVSFAPSTRAGFKRGSDMPVERWSQASPLPTQDGFFGTIQRKETIQKLTGATE